MSNDQAQQEAHELVTALATVLAISRLEVRRAAFSQEIGSRMSEAFRADIADACRRLEDVAIKAITEYHDRRSAA